MSEHKYEEAIIQFKRSIELNPNVPNPVNNLALCYYQRVGTPRLPEQALYWMQQAADLGYGPAYIGLAEIYYSGVLGKPDDAEAKKWLEKAVEAQVEGAEELLKQMK